MQMIDNSIEVCTYMEILHDISKYKDYPHFELRLRDAIKKQHNIIEELSLMC